MIEPQGTSAPRCYHCGYLLQDINAFCPICTPASPVVQDDRLQSERDRLYGHVSGLLGLLQLIRRRNDVPDEVKAALNTNHRVTDAAAYLTQIVPPQ